MMVSAPLSFHARGGDLRHGWSDGRMRAREHRMSVSAAAFDLEQQVAGRITGYG